MAGDEFARFWQDMTMGINQCSVVQNKWMKYQVTGTRMSGESTTYLGNTLVNLCATNYLLKQQAIEHELIPYGDDGLIGYNGEIDFTRLKNDYARLGLIIKIEQGKLTELKFLSSDLYV